jgi:hypothetical protein
MIVAPRLTRHHASIPWRVSWRPMPLGGQRNSATKSGPVLAGLDGYARPGRASSCLASVSVSHAA